MNYGILLSIIPDSQPMKIGAAFPSYIRTEKIKRRSGGFFNKNYSIRTYLLPLLLIIITALIIIRLFFLQIFQGSYYRNLSDLNRTKTIAIHAPRGIIFDRNQKPLVFNVPGYREVLKDKIKLIESSEAIKMISEGKNNLEIDSLRSYPYKDIAAHVLGYIGEVSKEELGQKGFSSYKGGELIGKIGMEKEYESMLKGIDGKELIEVDSLGKTIRGLGRTDPIPGKNISLSLDLELQRAVFESVSDIKKGAVIVSTPMGEILALVSKPSFDSNLFTMGDGYQTSGSTHKNASEILEDQEGEPLLNRAIGGVYPPGSTFKLVVAAAGLENGNIDKDFKVEDTGILTVGDFSFSNWYFSQYGRKDGAVNVVKAIKRSNDIFFYKLAEKIGVEKISESARNFGLGKTLGIDMIGEQEGLVPTPLWKEKVIGDKWFLGDTYHYGIGQGYLLTTPLQVNAWTQVIANGGTLYQPRLLKNQKSKIKNQKFLSDNASNLIRQGMVESCQPGGVAWPLFDFKVKNEKLKIDGKNILEAPQATTSADFNDYRQISIACKTGTAQHGGEETLPHAWITLFAPAYDPQIVVTVLSEESGEGSNIAAPIAKKILEEWFER
ncbi:hypothetical protein HYT32_01595 [Candidatus Roizmanbacteria bacterium]|nr:hypothetical protein [Candidatus Roizmanbacteria bacterium]